MSALDDARTVARDAWQTWGLPPGEEYPGEEDVPLEEYALEVQAQALEYALEQAATPQERTARQIEILTVPIIACMSGVEYGVHLAEQRRLPLRVVALWVAVLLMLGFACGALAMLGVG